MKAKLMGRRSLDNSIELHVSTRCRAIAKMTARCALYIGYSPNLVLHASSTTLRGFDSERIQADRVQRIDRMLILNVANNCVASSSQRHAPSI